MTTLDFAVPLTPPRREVVVDKRTGQPRQAGASQAEGQWIREYRFKMEESLFAFTKGVLGKDYLTPHLHRPVCDFIQQVPPQRKCVLLPREHGKTTIVGHSLPLHILIQPRDHNGYFPGEDGCEQRIIMIGEKEQRATDSLRVIETALETNEVLRALWPNRVWDNPRKESKKWNEKEMIVPRRTEWPDPSIRAIGVGGAVTGAHPSVLIKDDLITLEAANSPVVMQAAIDWHVASRALINKVNALEFIIGTRWAVSDLYNYIQQNDPTVAFMTRAIVEDGEPIWPEAFTLDKVGQLMKEFGVLFHLLFMNSASNPALTDFDELMLRDYRVVGDMVEYDEDDRDVDLARRVHAPAPAPAVEAGRTLTNGRVWQEMYQPGQGFRLRML